MIGIEEEWDNFCNNTNNLHSTLNANTNSLNIEINDNAPKCGDIYISTKTKILYLSKEVELKKNFWKIPIIPYTMPIEGVIKKQIKYNFENSQEIIDVEKKIENESAVEMDVLSKSNNINKFKEVRKISIGVCKKDITTHRTKKKSAFYNCFVLIIRLQMDTIFREAHVKIFNTGKIEIPGIQNDEFMDKILTKLLEILNNTCKLNIEVKKETCETVLINSNFNCGYFINREILYDKLKYKYRIHTAYDPCSYPGIMSKFWFNHGEEIQTGVKTSANASEISFMIFRTGSVLIVGKCNENMLLVIYEFLKEMFITEYKEIFRNNDTIVEKKEKKRRKKYIKISQIP
jgi:TATA-box binding protein (TBP) (component of TFIID and TFIIIB)